MQYKSLINQIFKIMIKITSSLQNTIKDFAVKNWQKYSFKKEWQTVILLLLILKLSTSAVSVFSGFFFLENIFFSFTNSETASKIFSIIALIIVEGLCSLFLAKFFKFALRAEIKTALLPFTCALLIFSISFYISCNGISLFTSQSEDLSKEINSKYNFQISELKNETKENILQVESAIRTIKENPENWSGGKRCILSENQNREIANYFNIITNYKSELNKNLKELEFERKQELTENNKLTINKADRFYKFVAVIMFIQVICTAGLWFFWCKISGQDAPENDYKESINEIYTKANRLIDSGLTNCINQKFSIITTAFAQLQNDLQTKQITAKKAEKTEKKVGFDTAKNAEINETKTTEKTFETSERETANANENNAGTRGVSSVNHVELTPVTDVNTIRVCCECGKPLNYSQISRKAKFCSAGCRVKNYNKQHPNRRDIVLKENNLTH